MTRFLIFHVRVLYPYKKVVTEGREEGPNEGEGWRLAASRRRQCSIALEARHAELRTFAKDMNDYFLNPTREAYRKGRRMSDESVSTLHERLQEVDKR